MDLRKSFLDGNHSFCVLSERHNKTLKNIKPFHTSSTNLPYGAPIILRADIAANLAAIAGSDWSHRPSDLPLSQIAFFDFVLKDLIASQERTGSASLDLVALFDSDNRADDGTAQIWQNLRGQFFDVLSFTNPGASAGLVSELTRDLIVRHYQYMILHDFLPRILSQDVYEQTVLGGTRFILGQARGERIELSLEFITLCAVILLNSIPDASHGPQTNCKTVSKQPQASEMGLFVNDLFLEGFLDTTLPNGCCCGLELARFIGHEGLSKEAFQASASERLFRFLDQFGFLERTPLWVYLLTEARFLGEGRRLGPLGSQILADTLITIVAATPTTILHPFGPWSPSAAQPVLGTTTPLERLCDIGDVIPLS